MSFECSNCNNEVKEHDEQCPHCGAKFTDVQDSSITTPVSRFTESTDSILIELISTKFSLATAAVILILGIYRFIGTEILPYDDIFWVLNLSIVLVWVIAILLMSRQSGFGDLVIPSAWICTGMYNILIGLYPRMDHAFDAFGVVSIIIDPFVGLLLAIVYLFHPLGRIGMIDNAQGAFILTGLLYLIIGFAIFNHRMSFFSST